MNSEYELCLKGQVWYVSFGFANLCSSLVAKTWVIFPHIVLVGIIAGCAPLCFNTAVGSWEHRFNCRVEYYLIALFSSERVYFFKQFNQMYSVVWMLIKIRKRYESCHLFTHTFSYSSYTLFCLEKITKRQFMMFKLPCCGHYTHTERFKTWASHTESAVHCAYCRTT